MVDYNQRARQREVQVWQKVLFKEQAGISGDQKGVAGSEMTGELVYDQEENRINNNQK